MNIYTLIFREELKLTVTIINGIQVNISWVFGQIHGSILPNVVPDQYFNLICGLISPILVSAVLQTFFQAKIFTDSSHPALNEL